MKEHSSSVACVVKYQSTKILIWMDLVYTIFLGYTVLWVKLRLGLGLGLGVKGLG